MKTARLLMLLLFALQWIGVRSIGSASEPRQTATTWKAFEIADLISERKGLNRPYLRFLDESTLSAGIYVLPAGGEDNQTPHDRDEVYYVIRGRAVLRVGNDEQTVGPGSVLFVPAQEEHRFQSITEDLQLLVFFSTANVNVNALTNSIPRSSN